MTTVVNVAINEITYDLSIIRVTKPLWLDSDETSGYAWKEEDHGNTPESILPDDYKLEHIFAVENLSAGYNYKGMTHNHFPEFLLGDITRLFRTGAIQLAKRGESLPEIDANEYLPLPAIENIDNLIHNVADTYGLDDIVWKSDSTDSGESLQPTILESLCIPSRTCVGYSGRYNFEIEINDNREVWLNIRVEVKLAFVIEDYKFISESPIKIILTDFDRMDYLDDMEAELQDESPLAVVYQEKVCVVPKP